MQKQLSAFALGFISKMARYACYISDYCDFSETVKEFTAQLLERDYECLQGFISDEYPEEMGNFQKALETL